MSSLFSNGIDRRTFLKGSVATAAGLALGNPFFGGYANAAETISPGNHPYVTTITPEMIADNDKNWVYYGAEANDRPLKPWDKPQMAQEDFNKDAMTLKCSCYYPNAGDIGHGIHWETFSYLEYQFEGRLKFDRYFGQSLHGLVDGWKALRAGLVDITQIYHIHNQGAFNLFHADGLPFLTNNVVVATQVMEEMYPKWFKKEVERQQVHLGWIPHFDVQGLICTTPIRTLEDFKGKRIMGFGGEVMRNTLIALGATPVAIPTPDVFIGLQRGVVDGVALGRWQHDSVAFPRSGQVCDRDRHEQHRHQLRDQQEYLGRLLQGFPKGTVLQAAQGRQPHVRRLYQAGRPRL